MGRQTAFELLLVLDNAEHVFLACSRIVDLIARSCPGLRVIITSRRPLGFAGERVISLAQLEPAAAAELLLRRAAEHGSDAELARDPAGVATLCQLLDGLPLALELAAAKLRTMSLLALTERMTARPALLAVEGRPGLAHQRGLFATLYWSYNLLAEPSRLLLTRLAVFAGTFSLADAELVHELQAPTLLPEIHQALATIETRAGNLPKAGRHVREVLEFALPRSDVIDAVGALHLAVVLAAKANNSLAAQLAAAVRDCRLATGLPSWPFTEAEYAAYEPEGAPGPAVPAGPVRHDLFTRACDLALSSLGSRLQGSVLSATHPLRR